MNAAKQTIANCAQMMSLYTSIPERRCQRFLNRHWIGPDLLAVQMQFWMTKEYISHVGCPPADFPKKVYRQDKDGNDVRVETQKSINFDKDHGHHIKDKAGRIIPNLGGAVHGAPEPIKAGNMLFFILAMCIQAARDHRPMFEAYLKNAGVTQLQARWRGKLVRKHGLFAKQKQPPLPGKAIVQPTLGIPTVTYASVA